MNTSATPTISSTSENNREVINESFDLISANELTRHIRQCALNDRASQKKIYAAFYSYAHSICKRYVQNQDEVMEIINDGFLKIFKEIHRYEPAFADVVGSFKGWLRKIMLYTAIDHFRKNKKYKYNKDIEDGDIQSAEIAENAVDKISYKEILNSIMELTPVYKAVLTLFILDGCTHQEIASMLDISVGTSKSNLAKARIQLQKILFQRYQISFNKRAVDSRI